MGAHAPGSISEEDAMQIDPVDKFAAPRGSEPIAPRHAFPTSRPPMHSTSTEPEPTSSAPSRTAGRGTTSTTPPKFSHRLDEALHREGRLGDLAGGLTRHQVNRMLAGLPPGGFDGDFAHMGSEQLKALAQLMRGDGGPLAAGQTKRYTFDPTLPVDKTPRPA
jgi:hypothetical protein